MDVERSAGRRGRAARCPDTSAGPAAEFGSSGQESDDEEGRGDSVAIAPRSSWAASRSAAQTHPGAGSCPVLSLGMVSPGARPPTRIISHPGARVEAPAPSCLPRHRRPQRGAKWAIPTSDSPRILNPQMATAEGLEKKCPRCDPLGGRGQSAACPGTRTRVAPGPAALCPGHPHSWSCRAITRDGTDPP